ncbi:MAG: hypothetical protein K9L88_18595 [Chromatiaceae bacterium]|nr:hypothetical protein [Chromatiaceae bacterium]
MDNKTKQAAFKARMKEKGLAQVTEWVPVTEREHFKKAAAALREGLTITIGQPPDEAPKPDSVTSNHAPKAGPMPGTRDELVARRTQRKAKPRAKAPSTGNTAHQERQERYAAQWAGSTEPVRVLDGNGIGYDARVLTRETVAAVSGMTGKRLVWQKVKGIVKKGNTYQGLAFSIWPKDGIRVSKPSGWSVEPDAEVARARRRVRELHPDKGGPGGDEFQAAKSMLDALTGRNNRT